MKLLLTGSSGYTGKGIAQVLSGAGHHIRGIDVKAPADGSPETIVGSLGDLGLCRAAVEGVDAVVMCHMAPNPDGYKTPEMGIDVNVKGTANLYYAMQERGLKRCVSVSTCGVMLPAEKDKNGPIPGDGPYNYGPHERQSFYSLTKILKENVARYFHDQFGIVTTLLRPGWIVYDETHITKYGWKLETYDPSLVDPRDIGRAAVAALALASPKFEAFTLAQLDTGYDLSRSKSVLNWNPQYTFAALPRAKKG